MQMVFTEIDILEWISASRTAAGTPRAGFSLPAECPLLADSRQPGSGNHVYSSGCFRPKADVHCTAKSAPVLPLCAPLLVQVSQAQKTQMIRQFSPNADWWNADISRVIQTLVLWL